jgi:Deoxyribonuclease NucA/NucB
MRRWTAIGGVIAAAATFAFAAAGPGSSALTPSHVAACKRIPRHVIVDLNDDRHHAVIDHAFDARRVGHPRVLHIRRAERWANHRAALSGIPKRKGYDRDQYPPAIADEGGKGASVRYIARKVNRTAERLMGKQLEPYCNGQSFVVER